MTYLANAIRLRDGRLEWRCRFCRERHTVDPKKRGHWGGYVLFSVPTPCTRRESGPVEVALRVIG